MIAYEGAYDIIVSYVDPRGGSNWPSCEGVYDIMRGEEFSLVIT